MTAATNAAALSAIKGTLSGASAHALLLTGVHLASRAAERLTPEIVAELGRWADEVRADFPGLDYDDGEGDDVNEDAAPFAPRIALDVKPGDLWKSSRFAAPVIVLGVERLSPMTVQFTTGENGWTVYDRDASGDESVWTPAERFPVVLVLASNEGGPWTYYGETPETGDPRGLEELRTFPTAELAEAAAKQALRNQGLNIVETVRR